MADFTNVQIDGKTYNVSDVAARNGLNAVNAKLAKYDTIDAVTYGIDNTGATDVSAAVTAFLKVPAKNHYFPSGTYKLNSPVNVDCYNTSAGVQLSIECAPDAKFVAGADISTLFNIQGEQPGFGVISGGTFDCDGKAASAIIIAGVNAPGFVVQDALTLNPTDCAIVVGSSSQASAGHQRIVNCRLYAPVTLAGGMRVYCPDVKILDCEIYYTSCAIESGAYAVFVADSHLWSGGSAQDSNSTDKGIYITMDSAQVVLNNVYMDSFSYSVYATGILFLTGDCVFVHMDAERTFIKQPPVMVYADPASLIRLSGVSNDNSGVQCNPWVPDNVYEYSIRAENFPKRRFEFTQDNFPSFNLASTITGNGDRWLCLNQNDSMDADSYYRIGWILPAENSRIMFKILTSWGTAELNANFNRTTATVDVSSCTNKIGFPVEIGAVQIVDFDEQQVMIAPIYLHPSVATTNLAVTLLDNGSGCTVTAQYAEKVTSPGSIIGTIPSV